MCRGTCNNGLGIIGQTGDQIGCMLVIRRRGERGSSSTSICKLSGTIANRLRCRANISMVVSLAVFANNSVGITQRGAVFRQMAYYTRPSVGSAKSLCGFALCAYNGLCFTLSWCVGRIGISSSNSRCQMIIGKISSDKTSLIVGLELIVLLC